MHDQTGNMNFKELAHQYGVLPPEEKKLYCTKCGAPKHGGECATTVGPPLWFDEANTIKPKMEAPKSPRRNNRARWFLVSAFALLGLVIVRIALRPTATDTADTSPASQTPQPLTELSHKAGMLTMFMARSEVIETLGAPPTWVFLPGDPSEFTPKEGMLVTLIWKNGLCPAVIADFDAGQKLIGWDEGRSSCFATTEAEMATFLPPVGKYGCADPRRSIYCGTE
jgi:hypothetical protein